MPTPVFFLLFFQVFLLKTHESSIFINDFFTKPCNSSFVYDLPATDDYHAENASFLLCSNITIQSAESSSRISLKFSFVSFEIANSATFTIKNCDLSFKFNASRSDFLVLHELSSLFLKETRITCDVFLGNFRFLHANNFDSIVFTEITVAFMMNSSDFLAFFNVSEGNLLEINGFYYENPYRNTREIAEIRDVFTVNFTDFAINDSSIEKGLFFSGKIAVFSLKNSRFSNNKFSDFLMFFSNFPLNNSIITIKNTSFARNSFENTYKNMSFIEISSISLVFLEISVQKNEDFSIKIEKFAEIMVFSSEFSSNAAFSSNSLLDFINIEESAVSITISSCSFLDNFAQNSQNSVVLSLFYQGITIISDSFFSNNTFFSTNPLNSSTEGTACIFSPFTSFPRFLHINSSIFKENSAFSSSSCIFFEGSHFSLKNSLFLSNSLLKKTGFFQENTVSSRKDLAGSTILLNVLSTSFVNSEFRNSCAFSASAINLRLDFRIEKNEKNANFEEFGEFLFENVSIFDGISEDDGASLVINIAEFQDLRFFFTYCVFSGNLAEEDGGVFKFFGFFTENSSFLIENTILYSNSAKRGGVLMSDLNFAKNSIFEFFRCFFVKNSASSSEEGGGVFYNAMYSELSIKNCSFYDNFALNRASLIYMNYGVFRDFASSYRNNSAGNEAGMVILIDDSEFSMNFSVIASSFSRKNSGFAMIFKKSSLSLSNCELRDFSSQKTAFLHIGQEAVLSLFNCSMENFTVFEKKAVILLSLGTRNSLLISQCEISQWKTQENSYFDLTNTGIFIYDTVVRNSTGSVISARNCEISIRNLSVSLLVCSEDNSEFCLMNFVKSTVNLENFTISTIFLKYKQSLIKALLSDFRMVSAEISLINPQNSATFNSNFLIFLRESTYEVSSSRISMINLTLFRIILSSGVFLSVFAENIANSTFFGQFISCFLCFYLEIGFSEINGMKSPIGPVLQINDIYQSFFYQTLTFSSFFEKNLTFYIHNSNFCNNSAENLGGVLYILDFSLFIENCSFAENSASEGGVFFLNCSDFANGNKCNWLVKNNRFLKNKAEKRGGVLHWLNRAPVFGNDNVLEGNTAQNGHVFSSNPIKLLLHDSMKISLKSSIVLDLLDAYDQVFSSFFNF